MSFFVRAEHEVNNLQCNYILANKKSVMISIMMQKVTKGNGCSRFLKKKITLMKIKVKFQDPWLRKKPHLVRLFL